MQSDKGISIIICCYNSESRLHRVLQAIAQQKTCASNKWEVIVVNNNSSDNTGTLANNIFSQPLFNGMNCRVVDEPEPGLSAAREKGFKESVFDYVLFCDDDNILETHFMANAVSLIEEFPAVDIFGSWCEGEFEIPPPAWSIEMISSLAVGRPAEKSGFLQKPVNGACMIVKKDSYRVLKEKSFRFLLSDRKADALTAGGDSELCYAMLLSGGSIYFSESLLFIHLIPAVRLQKSYFKRLYMIAAKQDFTGIAYQWMLKEEKTSFTKFYFFLLFTYCKILAYCLKQLIITGHFFYYTLVFKQRLRFLLHSLLHIKEIRDTFYKVTLLSKNLRD